jgi:hypothetical protein
MASTALPLLFLIMQSTVAFKSLSPSARGPTGRTTNKVFRQRSANQLAVASSDGAFESDENVNSADAAFFEDLRRRLVECALERMVTESDQRAPAEPATDEVVCNERGRAVAAAAAFGGFATDRGEGARDLFDASAAAAARVEPGAGIVDAFASGGWHRAVSGGRRSAAATFTSVSAGGTFLTATECDGQIVLVTPSVGSQR